MSRDVTEDGSLLVHPAYQFGQVCCGISRVPASAVAGCVVAGDSVDTVAENYGLTRLHVLTACWWEVESAALRPKSKRTASEQRVVERWANGWWDTASRTLGGHSSEPCPDPPGLS